MYFLGIDAGTTSLKVILFDENGNAQAVAREEYALEYPRMNFVEMDSERYWDACKLAIARVLRDSKIEPDHIVSLAISSQGETFIPIDDEGRLLRKAIVWYDNRSSKQSDIIRDHFSVRKIFEVTGQNDVVPTWTATKILWMKQNEPQVFKRVSKYLLVEDYLVHRLSNQFATDYSVICTTMMFDIVKRKWWSEMLDFVGITEEQLPRPSPSGVLVGTVSRMASRETGLSTKTVIATGALDHAAGAVGIGNVRPSLISETTGAAMALVAPVKEPFYDPERRIPLQHHATKDGYFLMPWNYTAGMVLRWFRDNFGELEIEMGKKSRVDPYDILSSEASKINAGSDGLIVLPHFAGTAFPEFEPKARGAFFGITLGHTKGHFTRAIMESVGYMLRRNIECLESLTNNKWNEIRSIGGGSRSDLWNQMKSDITRKRILTFKVEEAACLGAAILSGFAQGSISSLEDGARKMNPIRRMYDPQTQNADVYTKAYGTYLELQNRTRNLTSTD